MCAFLAIDDYDDRPLVIDQPEEKLDPKGTTQQPQVGTTVAGLQVLADRVAATQKT